MVAQGELKTGRRRLSDKKIDKYAGPGFILEHTYWGQVSDVSGTTDGGGYIRSELKVSNTSDVPINVRVFLDLDDTGDIWDAYARSGTARRVEHRWIEIGTIPPRASRNADYLWAVENQAGVLYAENFEVTFKIAPEIKIDYKSFRAFSQSKSQVSTVDR
jgi:hypothetical protein